MSGDTDRAEYDPFGDRISVVQEPPGWSGDTDRAVEAGLRLALDLIGHDIHEAFWGGVAPQHNVQPGTTEPFGDCYKCRVVADKLRESAAKHGVSLAALSGSPGSDTALDVEAEAHVGFERGEG